MVDKKRFFIFAIIFPLFCILISGITSFGIGERILCGGELFEEFPSPDGKILASVYQYNCGATTNFSTRIAFRKASQKWDVYSRKVIFKLEGEPSEHKIRIVWENETHLNIYLAHFSPKAGWRLTEYPFAGKTYTILISD